MKDEGIFVFFMKKTALLLCLATITLQAQDVKKILQDGNKLFEAGAYYDAIPFYREVLMYDNSLEAKEKLAQSYRLVNDLENAAYWYDLVIPVKPQERIYEFQYAQVLHALGNYSEAAKWYSRYADIEPRSRELADACLNINRFRADEHKFNLIPFSLNTTNDELGAIFFKNGVLFSSSGDLKNRNKAFDAKRFLEVYFAKNFDGGVFSMPQKQKGINSALHDGPVSVSSSGQLLWLTRNTENKAGKMQEKARFKVFSAQSSGDHAWKNLQPFKENNPQYSVMHAATSPDGTKIFFVSDRPGGYGGKDIYVVYRAGEVWSEAQNLGSQVNTIGDELFPFYHSSGELYFSSNGHAGMGGFDIYVTRRPEKDWQKPQNVGAPLNSSADDLSISWDSQLNTAFVASRREGGKGALDLYLITRKEPLKNLPQAPINDNEIFALKNEKDVLLNTTLNLKKIEFEFKQSKPLNISFAELDKVSNYLQKHPQEKLLIESHTDARGDAVSNLVLSQERVAIIKDYLLTKGIDNQRIKAVGLGATVLLNKCKEGVDCSEKEHAVNDRVIFKIENPDKSAATPLPTTPQKEEKDKKSKTKDKKESDKEKAQKQQELTAKEQQKEIEKRKKEVEKAREKQAKEAKKQQEAALKAKKEEREKQAKDKKAEQAQKELLKKQAETEIIPTVATTAKEQGFTFRVNVGAYKSIDTKLSEKVEKLGITPKITQSKEGETIHIGMFGSIYDAEQVQKYFDKNGYKTDIEVFVDGQATKMRVKDLKKQGIY